MQLILRVAEQNLTFNTVPSMNAKYFTIDIKGNGIAQKLTVSLSGLAYITVNMAEGRYLIGINIYTV